MVDITEQAGAVTSKILGWALWIILIVVVLTIAITLIVWLYKRRKWNIKKVIIRLPRAGGTFMTEIGKGHVDINEGIVDIKRKGLKAVGMKPFDVRIYLQGNNCLEVMQVSPTDYLPILPDSYKELTHTDGTKHIVFDIKTDLQKRKTWKNYMERAAKNRFTLAGFLDKHWRAIELSIITFILFLGFSILWMRLPNICAT